MLQHEVSDGVVLGLIGINQKPNRENLASLDQMGFL